MVFEHQDEHASQWAAITSIAMKFGVSSETLRKWVRRAQTDDGLRPGVTTEERERLKALERENRELRRVKGAFIPIRASPAGFLGPFGLPRTRGRAQETSRRAVGVPTLSPNRAIADAHCPAAHPHDA
jgi:hypothetical protein